MVKKPLIFYVILGILTAHPFIIFAALPQSHSIKNLSKTTIGQSKLPAPYNYLLTQPLMTKGIEQYYQRTPIIRTLYSEVDKSNNTYFRAILMLLDNNKARNNPDLAQSKNETMVAELAFITINFKELPSKFKEDVLNTNSPFGQLLVTYQINTLSKNRRYFSVQCNKELSSLMHCTLNNKLYGRSHTLIREDNKRWVAHVTEILS